MNDAHLARHRYWLRYWKEVWQTTPSTTLRIRAQRNMADHMRFIRLLQRQPRRHAKAR
jgi:hypothetical protein